MPGLLPGARNAIDGIEMTGIDLHAIANTPGYGAARDALQKAGMWDEYAGLPARTYAVAVEFTIRETITVKARHPHEAEDKARWRVIDSHDAGVDVDFVQIEALEDKP